MIRKLLLSKAGRMSWLGGAMIAGLTLGSISGAFARPTTIPIDVFNTGVDASHNVLTPGSPDIHWSLISYPTQANGGSPTVTGMVPSSSSLVVETPHPAWLPNQATSTWIGPTQSPNTDFFQEGDYVYQTTFNLTNYDQVNDHPTLNFSFAADNHVSDISLNSTSIYSNPYTLPLTGGLGSGAQSGDYSGLTSGSTTNAAAFHNGANTVTITLRNGDGSGGDYNGPTGLQAQLTGTLQPVPAPPAAISMGIGSLVGLITTGVRRRRTQRKATPKASA